MRPVHERSDGFATRCITTCYIVIILTPACLGYILLSFPPPSFPRRIVPLARCVSPKRTRILDHKVYFGVGTNSGTCASDIFGERQNAVLSTYHHRFRPYCRQIIIVSFHIEFPAESLSCESKRRETQRLGRFLGSLYDGIRKWWERQGESTRLSDNPLEFF